MRLLLDTHTFLWFITADPKLSGTAEAAIRDAGNQPLLSVASVWEIAIKVSIGRLPIPEPLETFIPGQLALNHIRLLPIELSHSLATAHLPLYHRDPFDRLLIAQAMTENLPIITSDQAFGQYPVQKLW